MASLARHVLLELNGCNRQRLSDLDFLRVTLLAAAREAEATIVDESFHTFPPYGGVSGVVIILESHISIHTWPEHGYAAADIFTCGTSVKPERATDLLIRELEPEDSSIVEMERGVLNSLVAHEAT